MAKKNKVMNELTALAKRRGIIFQSSEIYGGINACWDMGPLGVEMKRNLKGLWWKHMVQMRDDVEGLDAAILMHPKVWVASGHVESFTDPMVECKSCHHRFREDNLKKDKCPDCGGELTEPRMFNLMFKTHMGPVEESGNVIYLRPETAQGIYINYENVRVPARQKLPFGIGQIGKAFRNEITPGNFIFRTREFEQMEMQFFVHPDETEKWFEYWLDNRYKWHTEVIGLTADKLHRLEHPENKLAHYARRAVDLEFDFPFGQSELEGIHDRGKYDLSKHQEYSNKKLEYFDQKRDEHYIPYIIETSGGVDRTLLALLSDAYTQEQDAKGKTRTVLKLHPRIAAIKAGVFPLVKRDGMDDIGKKLATDLRKEFNIFYDEGGSIGRRYRRADEAGTPFCITIDSDTLEDNSVTIRERDTMEQIRVPMDKIPSMIRAYTNLYERDRGFVE
ncbi:MAG: glycine--tRNA ligase [Candidatus Zixiibacteriota bacterium]